MCRHGDATTSNFLKCTPVPLRCDNHIAETKAYLLAQDLSPPPQIAFYRYPSVDVLSHRWRDIQGQTRPSGPTGSHLVATVTAQVVNMTDSGNRNWDTSRLSVQFLTFTAERKVQGRNCEGEGATCVPFSALLEFWTKENIDQIFQSCDEFPITQDVRRNYIRVLSTLVYISVVENANYLHYFHNIQSQQRDDTSLPWLSIPQHVFEGPHATHIFDLFFEHQWMFCPAVLDQEKRMSDRNLHPRHVLPFTTDAGIHISHEGRDATLSVVNINEEAHSHLEHNVSIS